MRSSRPTVLVALAPVALAGLLVAAAPASAASGDVAFALQQGKLVSFNPDNPGTFTSSTPVTGIGAGEGILDLAVRPSTGALYALTGPSGFGATGPERIYTINTTTGAASLASTLSTDLPSNQYTIAFNPSVDRLRVVGVTTTDNYRVNVDTGATTTDTGLAYAAGDPNAGQTPRITGIGYTASPAGGATTLYDYDLRNALSATPTRILARQNPPDAGTLNTQASIAAPTSAFGQDLTIGSSGGVEVGYLTGSTGDGNQSQVFRVNLTDGSVTALGGAGARIANGPISGITIRRAATPAAALPEFPLTALALVGGLGAAGALVVRRRRTAPTA